MTSVQHFTLIIFFFIHTARGQIGGYLYFELVNYENRQDRLADGGSCEIFGGSCDPYFKICIGLEKSSSGCELLSYKTEVFENRRRISGTSDARKLGSPLRARILNPVPRAVRVTVTTLEYDKFGPTQNSLISVHEDVVRFNPFPNGRLSTSAIPIITMNRKDRAYNRVDMQIKVYSVCDKNVYGKFCERHCVPSATYNCDDEGNKICLPGYRGDDCHIQDECRFQPCAPGAVCVYESSNSQSHVCKCNGGSGPECYPGYDFCKDKPCQNGAICVSSNSSCLCYRPFYGQRCEHMINLCQHVPCENNGTCMMSSAGDKLCLCLPGFQGDYCEIEIKPTTPAEPMNAPIIHVAPGDFKVATAGVNSNEWIWPTVGIIIVILVVLFVVLAIYGRRRLLNAKRSVSRQQRAYEDAQNPFSIYEMPILSNPYDWSENSGQISTGTYSQAQSSVHAEYARMNAPNENIYEEHLYEDCEKLGPVTTTRPDPVYAISDNICSSQNDKIPNEETQPLADDTYINADEYDFGEPPPLPLRNLP